MREIAAQKMQNQELEREYFDTQLAINMQQSSNNSVRNPNYPAALKIEKADVKIKSKPFDLNSKLKIKKEEAETEKLEKIGKLIDQLRIACNQPTSEEIAKNRNLNFRRPEKIEEVSKVDKFMNRS